MTDQKIDNYLKKFKNSFPVKRHEDNEYIIPEKGRNAINISALRVLECIMLC